MPQENPPLLDKTMNTTEQTPRNLADVLASGLANIANNVKPDGGDISIDVPGMSATNVNDGFSELKGTLDDITARNTFNCTASNKTGTSDCVIEGQRNYVISGIAYIALVLKSGSNTSDIEINLPSNITLRDNGFITMCGKGARWSVTSVQYLYLGKQEMALNNITANTYYHVMLTTPVAVS